MATDKELIDSLKVNWLPSDYYNYYDLNRVEQATIVVKNRIAEYKGILVTLDSPVTNRTRSSYIFASDLNRIETNILRLILAFSEAYNFPDVKTDWKYNDPFSFADARRYEQTLYDMYYTIENNISNFPYAGQLYAGQLGVVY
jgi:hypothetical protein